ncbi:MAG: SOS response-associated peptidase [Actinobacteria bacterium]|nr:SOS response-associated peptidase [Actinomycetota bacterium]
MEDLIAEFSSLSDGEHSVGLRGEMPLFANWNVAPTQLIPVVRPSPEGALELETMRWGLVPSWSKDPGKGVPLINARSETVTDKTSFRNLVPRQRCMIPMNGFYEWDRRDAKNKIPHFVTRTDGRLMWALGLWNRPEVLDGLATVTMLTCASVDALAKIHDRSPVQVEITDAIDWTRTEHPPLGLLEDPPLCEVWTHRVDKAVNSIRNNGPHLIDPVVVDDPPRGHPELF